MMRIALDIATGMEYLHENGYIHGDLALRNCIINADGNVKVRDFCFYEDKHENCYFSNSKMKGSMPCPVRWRAPENLPYEYNSRSQMIWKKHEKSYAGDVWAFAGVLYELWTRGERPFGGCDNDQMVCKEILDGETAATWDTSIMIRSSVKELMESCWEYDWSERPSFHSIVDYFEGLVGSDSDEQDD